MLNRREILKVTAAGVIVAASGFGVAAATPGKLVGHSFTSLKHVLHGIVPMEEVEAIYLTPMMLNKIQLNYGLSWRYEIVDGKVVGWSSHFFESVEEMERMRAMWLSGFILPRPDSMGMVGRLVWTRDGEPYEPPALHGGLIEVGKASYDVLLAG